MSTDTTELRPIDNRDRATAAACALVAITEHFDPALDASLRISAIDGEITVGLYKAAIQDGAALADRLGLDPMSERHPTAESVQYWWRGTAHGFPVMVTVILPLGADE